MVPIPCEADGPELSITTLSGWRPSSPCTSSTLGITSLQPQKKLRFEEAAPKAQPKPAVPSLALLHPKPAHRQVCRETALKCGSGAQLNECWLQVKIHTVHAFLIF